MMRTLPAMLIVMLGGLSSFSSQALAFELSSPDIAPGSTIPATYVFNGFGCTGQNISPTLAWRDAPPGTQSFALMVHDPDAPTGGAGFWHWVLVNIPATTASIARGAGTPQGKHLPAGTRQIPTDFGTPGWGGPCPPVGDSPHRYNFTVYALKVARLELPPQATASLTGFIVNANALGQASFSALYGR